MKNSERTRDLLIKHYQAYPDLQIGDIFKFLHQSTFGCEHMVSSLDGAIDYIKKEYEALAVHGESPVEPLDGDYCRVHLSYLNKGLRAETLGKLFFESAKENMGKESELEEKLCTVRGLIYDNTLPLSLDEFESELKKWSADGYPALHHSEKFRECYHPAYRVISNRYVPFLPLFTEIDKGLQNGALTLAIEGGSASGKSTLSEILTFLYDCNIFHMDDFFLRPEQRTPERYAEIGGNVDRERFLEEVLLPHSRGETVNYRRFDCSTFTVCTPVTVTPKRLTVIEGAYSMHPDLSEYYDLSVFLEITPELQHERILKRNSPDMSERFFKEWIPLERRYFDEMRVKDRCDFVISIIK